MTNFDLESMMNRIHVGISRHNSWLMYGDNEYRCSSHGSSRVVSRCRILAHTSGKSQSVGEVKEVLAKDFMKERMVLRSIGPIKSTHQNCFACSGCGTFLALASASS